MEDDCNCSAEPKTNTKPTKTRAHGAHTPCVCTLQTQYRGTEVAVEDDCNCSAEHNITTQNPLNKNEAQIVLQMSVETWI